MSQRGGTRRPVVEALEARLQLSAARRHRAGNHFRASVGAASLDYLRSEMDQFNTRLPVYDDVSSGGNHFFAFAETPMKNAPVAVNGSWTDNPHGGATCIRCDFTGTDKAFGGFEFLNGVLSGTETVPAANLGETPGAGVDLTARPGWSAGARDDPASGSPSSWAAWGTILHRRAKSPTRTRRVP